jgi:small neutral amino acid transporter SnatA (MarC family)
MCVLIVPVLTISMKGWVLTTRKRIERFLDKFVYSMSGESLKETMPVLYQLYVRNPENIRATSAASAVTSEVVEVFKAREEKLVRFSQAIIDITSDLLGAIESGDALDHSFMTHFKGKFDFFRGALTVTHEADPQYKTNSPPAPAPSSLLIEKDKEVDKVSLVASAAVSSRRHRHPGRKSPSHGTGRTKRRKRLKEIDVHSLKFGEIVSDLYSKVHEVENFLIQSSEGFDKKKGIFDATSFDQSSDQSTMMKSAVASAMSASSLACTLAHIIVRPDKEDHTLQSRDAVVGVIVQNDILGIVKRSRRRASIERMEPETTDWPQLIATSMRNEGVVGFIHALRNFLPVQSKVLRNLALSLSETPTTAVKVDLEQDSHGEVKLESKRGTVVFLEASQCLCESLYRLVVAIGSTPKGREYLHTYGSELTSHTTKLLIQLPSDFSQYDKNLTAVFSDDVFEQSSMMEQGLDQNSIIESSYTESNNDSLSDRKIRGSSDGIESNPASSLRLWCILALTVLAAHSSSEESEGVDDVSRAVRRASGLVKRDNLQLLIVEDGALEWLNEAFFSLLMEILAAAFGGHPKVAREAVGNDSVAIGMAALSLDAKRQSQSRMNTSRSALNALDDTPLTMPMPIGPFTISSAASDSVPHELLVLLDLCLGMLLFAARSADVQRVLTSTPAFQELSKSLLKTLFRLLLLPQLTQALADGILVILNVLFKDQVQFRQLARDLKDLAVLEKKISIGGLKWFPDTGALQQLLSLIASNTVNPTESGNTDQNSSTNIRILAESNKYHFKSTGEVDVAMSLADITLGKVMTAQTKATDNTQLLDFLSRQKSYTGKVNTSVLVRYEDPSKTNYRPSVGEGADEQSNSLSSTRYRIHHENMEDSLRNDVSAEERITAALDKSSPSP